VSRFLSPQEFPVSIRTWLACAGAVVASGATSARAETISLKGALERAEYHPDLAAATAEIDIARGERRQAGLYMYNPELAGAAGPRYADEREIDVELSLSQTIELGGKRDARTDVAGADLARVRALSARARQQVRWGVRAAYARALVARARVEATAESEKVAAQLAELARARLAAGSGDRLSVNQSLAEIGRARRQRLLAELAYERACFALSSAVGVAGSVKLEPEGELAPRPVPGAPVAALVAQAQKNRPDHAATLAATERSRADVELQDALAVPDLTVGVTFAREERANIGLVTLAIELPLWNRNQGRRAAARAAVRRDETLERYAAAELARQVRVGHSAWLKARAAVAAFDEQALGSLRENLELTGEAFKAGKLSSVEFALLQRTFVEVQLDYLDAVLTEIDSYYSLMVALGDDGDPR
jgi:cobalt-zinc-cadmium efflux system outer membrane protein